MAFSLLWHHRRGQASLSGSVSLTQPGENPSFHHFPPTWMTRSRLLVQRLSYPSPSQLSKDPKFQQDTRDTGLVSQVTGIFQLDPEPSVFLVSTVTFPGLVAQHWGKAFCLSKPGKQTGASSVRPRDNPWQLWVWLPSPVSCNLCRQDTVSLLHGQKVFSNFPNVLQTLLWINYKYS